MDYEIVRSGRKTLAVEVTRDLRVVVRAPKGVTKGQIESFVTGAGAWIEKHMQKQRKRGLEYPDPTPQEIEVLKGRAKAILPGRVAHFSKIMGLTPKGIRVTSARTRLGSCSAKDSLCFSYLLMRYPEEVIDYVVVHELSHIAHKNHGAAFYQCIEAVLPDYRARRAIIRG